MQAVVNVVIPVFAIVLAGYVCGRLRLLGAGGSEALNGFVYFAALPALFFGSLAKVELAQILNWPYLAAYLFGTLATGLAALLAGRVLFRARGPALAVQNMAALFSNTGYMGIPLAITAFGKDATLPAILAGILNGVLVMEVLHPVDRSAAFHRQPSAAGRARCARRRPPISARAVGDRRHPVLGIAREGAGAAAHLLRHHGRGRAAGRLVRHGPVHGGKELQGRPGGGLRLFCPEARPASLGTFAIVLWLIPIGSYWRDVLMMMAALPTGSLVLVLASQHGTYVRRATGIILGSTLGSVITLSWLLDYLGVPHP